MIPTSLDVAGFTPAEGALSSPPSSFGSRWQNSANDSGNDTPDFRQVMNAYSRSNQDSDKNENQSRSSKSSDSKQPSGTTDQTDANQTEASDAATAAEQQPSTPSVASSFTGVFGLRKNAAAEPASAETTPASTAPAAGALSNTTTSNANAASGLATQFSGFSPLQLLLNGGSLNPLSSNALSSSALASSPMASANGQASSAAATAAKVAGEAAPVVTAKPLAAGVSPSSKTGKGKTDDVKRNAETNSDAAADPALLGVVAPLLPSSANAGTNAETANGPVASANGLAIGGMTPEALHLSATGESAAAATQTPAANNFAFAVRLTAPGADTLRSASNAAAVESPTTLLSNAQSALVTAGATAAELAGGEMHSGGSGAEGSGDGSNEAALLYAPETAPAGNTTSTSGTAASDATPAPAATTEPDPAIQSGQPVKNLHLQLAGDNNQRVDIRLVDVGGEMRVSVRAGDTKLAQTLQDHIPDLSNRLNQQSVRAEIWAPRTENAAQANSSNQSGQSGRGNDSGGQSGQGQQQQRGGSGRQQQNQPDWVDELENYSSRTTTTRSN